MSRAIEDIRADIAKIRSDWVTGAALYEPAGVSGLTMFDVQRKVLLSQLAIKVITEYAERNEKQPTEKVLEAHTHSAESYVKFVDEHIKGRTLYIDVNARMSELRSELAIAEMRNSYAEAL